MRAWAKRFAIVFGLGFIIYVYAVGVGAATGRSLSEATGLRGLRYLGGGLMLNGMTLWIARSRMEGGRPGLNPMFGLLLSFSAALLLIGAVGSTVGGEAFMPLLRAGLASGAAALVVGLLAMLVAPPEPRPAYDYPWMNPAFDPEKDTYAAGRVVPANGYSDDLTRIEGIDEQVAGLLAKAGLRRFSQLASTSPEALRDILQDGNLAAADPSSWPRQAILAANGDWDALQKLQERLRAEQPT